MEVLIWKNSMDKKEEKFILENKKNWERFENYISKKKLFYSEIIEYGKLYQLVIENLSHSQTNFQNSSTTGYLNQLVIKAHQKMQKQKLPSFMNIIKFFTHVFPSHLVKLRYSILFCAAIFIASILFSFFFVNDNPEMAEIFLSHKVYEKSMEDLELRRQFSNFDNIPKNLRVGMSFYIWFNNARVSIMAFALGITLGIGTLFLIVYNGFMIGALSSVYFTNGHFLDFSSILMVHGSIELIAIIYAGGAGFHIAAGLFFPGRKPRLVKIKEHTKESFLVIIGVVILLLIAGFIEGLITTLKLQITARLVIAGINLFFLTVYYIYGFVIFKKSRSKNSQLIV